MVTISAQDGTKLAVRRTGKGTPVVLVHGSAGGLDSWDPVVRYLADAFEVWVHARRGYPPSGAGTGPKTFADDVADLRAVLEQVGRPAHLSAGPTAARWRCTASVPGSRCAR